MVRGPAVGEEAVELADGVAVDNVLEGGEGFDAVEAGDPNLQKRKWEPATFAPLEAMLKRKRRELATLEEEIARALQTLNNIDTRQPAAG